MVLSIVDIIGTIAFAVSGVIVAIRNKLDLFGIFVLASITASGGGIIRDIVVTRDVPVFFTNWKYFVAITLTMIATCFMYRFIDKRMSMVILFDAIGLGVFTVTATYKAIEYGLPFLGVVFAGVITGIGGGIMRDILVSEIPLVFRSEIYAVPSMLGSILFYILYSRISLNLNTYICIMLILAVRMVSVKLKLNLPVISTKNDEINSRRRKIFRRIPDKYNNHGGKLWK